MVSFFTTNHIILSFGLICCLSQTIALAQDTPRTIHVFVALCDNEHQGIVLVPATLGNGDDPGNNLYWGEAYGVKTFFAKSSHWKLLTTLPNPTDDILERCIFTHTRESVYMVADAYRGRKIKQAVVDFLKAASGNFPVSIPITKDNQMIPLNAGGASQLVAYVGHNGLMDFSLWRYPRQKNKTLREAIILACASKQYFSEPLLKAGATPLLWTTGLMAPEAYTLESSLEGWILEESHDSIHLRAAKAYHAYQQCGLKAAKNLFATGM